MAVRADPSTCVQAVRCQSCPRTSASPGDAPCTAVPWVQAPLPVVGVPPTERYTPLAETAPSREPGDSGNTRDLQPLAPRGVNPLPRQTLCGLEHSLHIVWPGALWDPLDVAEAALS